jgi:hypothetical protein
VRLVGTAVSTQPCWRWKANRIGRLSSPNRNLSANAVRNQQVVAFKSSDGPLDVYSGGQRFDPAQLHQSKSKVFGESPLSLNSFAHGFVPCNRTFERA